MHIWCNSIANTLESRLFCINFNHCGLMTPYGNTYSSGSTLARAMACCLTAPSHYLNQCWFLISAVLWHSLESIFTGNVQATILCSEFDKNTATSPRGQWVHLYMQGIWHRYQKAEHKSSFKHKTDTSCLWCCDLVQWNLSITTTSKMKCITFDLFSNVF